MVPNDLVRRAASQDVHIDLGSWSGFDLRSFFSNWPFEVKTRRTRWYHFISVSSISKKLLTKNHLKNDKFFIWWSRIQKSKPFYNLTPKKSTIEKGQVNPGSKKFKFLDWYFWTKNKCFWTSSISGFQKCHFYYCRHQRMRFWGYMLAKNRYINLKFGMLYLSINI